MKTKTTKKCTAPKAAAKAETTTRTVRVRCPKTPKKAVTFTVHADKGKAVYLAGDFNSWDPTAKKMTFKNGVYSASVKLEEGEHQYKFVIDGTWCADPENVNSVANDQGTFNSVIVVK